jgi:AraC family transcriptional regulator
MSGGPSPRRIHDRRAGPGRRYRLTLEAYGHLRSLSDILVTSHEVVRRNPCGEAIVLQLRHISSTGAIVRSRQVTGFILTETAYHPGHRTPQHSHELGYFYTVLEGPYTETVGKEKIEPAPLTLAYRPGGEVHSHSCTRIAGRCFIIYPTSSDRFSDCLGKLAAADIRGPLVPWLLTRLYREFCRTDSASLLAIEGLSLGLLAEAARSPAHALERRPARWLEQVRELLHARFAETLTLAEIAEAVRVHPVYLARLFREQYGCTIGEYTRQLRIELACRQLTTSDTPLVAIALRAGFADQSHFTKTFKRLVGVTPGQFRAASRSR